MTLTLLYVAERTCVARYSHGKSPSAVVRWFWIAQFLLCLKNAESVLIERYWNDTIAIDIWFYLQLSALLPCTLLMLRALTITPIGPSSPNSDCPRIHPKTAEETASLFSNLTFGWLTNLFQIGYKRPLQMEDLAYLREIDRADTSVRRFYKSWRKELSKTRRKNAEYDAKYGHTSEMSHIRVLKTPSSRRKSDVHSAPKSPRVDHLARYRPSIVRAVLNAFGNPFLIAGPLKLIYGL